MVIFFTKQKETVQVTQDIKFLMEMQKHVSNLSCPFCSHKLILRGLERGSKGYEAQVACVCGLAGVINQSGFKFQHLPRQAK